MYVASNLLLYYDQGNPSGRRDPDVLVAKGVGNHFRLSFRVWEENTVPRVLFEIASRSTWREDLGEKRTLYASLGVPEYFLFDPEGVCLDPRLQGFRLDGGAYIPMTPAVDGGLESVELGARLVPEGGMLRLIDARTGAAVPMRPERAEQEREQAERERRRADQLAAEVCAAASAASPAQRERGRYEIGAGYCPVSRRPRTRTPPSSR